MTLDEILSDLYLRLRTADEAHAAYVAEKRRLHAGNTL